MVVTPIPFDLDLAQSAPGYVRTPGLHMSDLYNGLYAELEPKRYGKGSRSIEPGAKAAYMGCGLALEEALEQALASRLTGDGRPGELLDAEYGIIFSPDLVFWLEDMPDGDVRVAEIKLTWQSSRGYPKEEATGFPPKANKYITQLACYTRAIGTLYARLYGVFVNGTWRHEDTKWGFKPQPLAWDIVFTKREQDEEWNAVIAYGKRKGLL